MPIPTGNLKQNIQAQSFGTLGRPDPVGWIVKYLMPAGYPSTIFGAGGEGKSFLALDLAMHVAAQRDYWLGHKLDPASVLYLDFELDWQAQGTRAYDLATGMGLIKPPDDLLYLSALGFDTHTAFETAMSDCVEHDVGLVIIDSIGPAMLGDAESSADVLAFVDTYIKPFTAAGIAVLMIDHQAKLIKGERAKDKLPFGSVYKTNLSRSIIQVQGSWDESILTATLRHVKSNFGPKQDDFAARLTFAQDEIHIERADITVVDMQDEPTADDKIVDALSSGPKYPNEIAEATGLALQTVKNKLKPLRERLGKVEYTGEQHGQSRQVRLAAAYDKTVS